MTLGDATQAVSLMQSKTGGGSEAGVSPERKTQNPECHHVREIL